MVQATGSRFYGLALGFRGFGGFRGLGFRDIGFRGCSGFGERLGPCYHSCFEFSLGFSLGFRFWGFGFIASQQ